MHRVHIRHISANLYDAVNKALSHTFWLCFPCTESDDYMLTYIKVYIRLHNHLHHRILLHHKMHFKSPFLEQCRLEDQDSSVRIILCSTFYIKNRLESLVRAFFFSVSLWTFEVKTWPLWSHHQELIQHENWVYKDWIIKIWFCRRHTVPFTSRLQAACEDRDWLLCCKEAQFSGF